jgi:cytochrome c oxidase subunit 1
MHLGGLNLLSTAGVAFQAASVLLFITNIMHSIRRGKFAGPNPWGGSSLEWSTTSPPPEHNFNQIPVVNTREPLWLEPDAIIVKTRGEMEPQLHLPSGSYWPLITAVGATSTMALFMTGRWWAPLLGLAWTFLGVINWAYEDVG